VGTRNNSHATEKAGPAMGRSLCQESLVPHCGNSWRKEIGCLCAKMDCSLWHRCGPSLDPLVSCSILNVKGESFIMAFSVVDLGSVLWS
jgi:hypothetical protein